MRFDHPRQAEFLANLARSIEEHARDLAIELEEIALKSSTWPHPYRGALEMRVAAIEDYAHELRRYAGLATERDG